MAAPQRWDYRQGTLDNGLRVLTLEDRRTPLVNVQVWYHVGSKDEDPHRQGFAHMFEHMMFRGTDRIGPQDHFRYLQRCGARVNGYTSFDMTVYWETLPSSNLDRALWLEAERLAHLKISDAYFAAEREVVKEERRVNYLTRPYGLMRETLHAAAYREHPYRWTPIGNMPHLDAATTTELQAFFDRYYVPNNATLVVVGDVSHEQVMAKAQEYFGPIPRRPDPPRVAIREPAMTAPVRVEMTDIAPAPMLVLAHHAPAAPDPDAIAADLLARILGDGQSSRMYRHLVQGKELAVNIAAYNRPQEQGGLFTVAATLKPAVDIATAEQALLAELGVLLKDGIAPEELEKARNKAVADYVRTSQTVQGRADQLGYAAVILGDPERVNTDLERTRAVTGDEVLAVARRIFRDENRVTLIIRPGKKTAAEAAQDKSQSSGEKIPELPVPKELPAGRSPRPADLPRPEVERLDNGLRVVVFRDASNPAVTISYNAMIGARNDPPELAGLAYVATSTMRRGTTRHSGDQLAERIDRLGMSLYDNAYTYDTRYGIWTLSEHAETAVDTLAEILREPTFPEKEVAGFVSRAAAREAINEQDPSVLATRVFTKSVFGEHFLGRPPGGTSESLKRITRDAVVGYHQRHFGPAAASLIFAGDITSQQALYLARKYFGDWQAPTQLTPSEKPPAATATRILLVDRPGSVQSEIRIGQLAAVSRTDADYAASRLASQIFGESFSARINRRLRIEKGLTYGARGYFDVEADLASFRISTFTRTEKTAEAIRAALEEIDRLRAGTITSEELAEARDSLIGQFLMGLETPAQIAARWWDLSVYGLPETWYGSYLQSVAQVTDATVVDEVARRKLDPARLTIVVVGNAEKLRADLQAIAPVELADTMLH